jgi:hypothetical protein
LIVTGFTAKQAASSRLSSAVEQQFCNVLRPVMGDIDQCFSPAKTGIG